MDLHFSPQSERVFRIKTKLSAKIDEEKNDEKDFQNIFTYGSRIFGIY